MSKDLSPAIRNQLITTRLTVSERKKLGDRAAAVGQTPSRYVHSAIIEALGLTPDTKVILSYLELLTEDVARIETVVAYVVANLKVGSDLTAAVVDQFSVAASKRKVGYAAARLEAARIKASNGANA